LTDRDRFIEDAAKQMCEATQHPLGPPNSVPCESCRRRARIVLSTPSVAEALDRADLFDKQEHAINWHTTCFNCANLLDRCYGETVRAEKAETRLAQAEAVIEVVRDWRKSGCALAQGHRLLDALRAYFAKEEKP
jgi:hypothetical protein